MGLEEQEGLKIGGIPHGTRNLITDVPGVRVGNRTLAHGDVQTGVTVVLPHPGDLFHDKVMAASHVINGFGKSTGLVQINELGTLESPIVLTNTLSVGTAYTAVVRELLRINPDIGDSTGTVNPVICECNDGYLNDIRALSVTEEDVLLGWKDCREDFQEGAVGAGRGMSCHQLKGGIGSSSRLVTLDGKMFVVGALVLTNFGRLQDLVIGHDPAGPRIASWLQSHEPQLRKELATQRDAGSVITLIATDVPLSERQLQRVAKRAAVGLSRTGSYVSNGSGEIAIAFSTANPVPHYAKTEILPFRMVDDNAIDVVFRATADAVHEAVLSSLLHATTVEGRSGHVRWALGDILAKTEEKEAGEHDR